jgi:hypothetical protein
MTIVEDQQGVTQADTLRLDILACAGCGAPLRLADDALVECGHCGMRARLPAEYVALRRRAQEAKTVRREAEAAYRAMLAAALPAWVPKLWGMVGLPAVVIGAPLGLWLTQDVFAWQLRTWIVFGVFGPLLVGCLLLAFLMVRSNAYAYLDAIGGKLRPGPPTEMGEPTCGACRAPLQVEPDCLSATCDYCLADSWLQAVPESHVAGTDVARSNLADLLRAKDFQAFDTKLFIIVSTVVAGGFLLLLWLGFSPE